MVKSWFLKRTEVWDKNLKLKGPKIRDGGSSN
jgi:hypothetical protein